MPAARKSPLRPCHCVGSSAPAWDASVGWDISLSGDFLAAGIGTLQGVPVVFQSQSL